MAIAPDSVGAPGPDHVPAVGRDYIDLVPFTRLAPGGVWGRPSLASRDKGEAALGAAADATAGYIRDTFEALSRMKKTGG